LTANELPTIHKIALVVGKALGRSTPTVSDVEIAVNYRTLERIKKIAAGEEVLDNTRHKPNQEIMNKKERIEFWKLLSQRVIEDYETI
jgi:hypothetical protein